MGSLKSPCTTSYRPSIATIALNCLVFEKILFLQFGDRQTDKQTNKQIDSIDALSPSRYRERRLNNIHDPSHDESKFLLFYMCHFTTGLTHCYKTTVFFIYVYKT